MPSTPRPSPSVNTDTQASLHDLYEEAERGTGDITIIRDRQQQAVHVISEPISSDLEFGVSKFVLTHGVEMIVFDKNWEKVVELFGLGEGEKAVRKSILSKIRDGLQTSPLNKGKRKGLMKTIDELLAQL